MKTQLLGLCLMAFVTCTAQIEVPKLTITPDGFPDTTEWNAVPVQAILYRGTVENTDVQITWSDSALSVRFNGNLESSFMIPEVLIDPDYGRTAAWDSLDHWFHVSATDCHSIGVYGDYNTCVNQAQDWKGGPNMAMSINADDIEFAIPWATLNYIPMMGDTIGLSLDITNTANEWNHWPTTAHRNQPNTWGYIVLGAPLSEVEHASKELYFTPLSDRRIRVYGLQHQSQWQVIDMLGRTIASGNSEDEFVEITLPAEGMYVVRSGEQVLKVATRR
ncbi:MAG: hypothetical protein HWD92_00940 [Flavobacteriia bacterium]|nr:hypothetical protein [Flavobacteriia bacterium]